MTPKFYGYIRASTGEQKNTLEAQAARLETYHQHLQAAPTFIAVVDAGVSGHTPLSERRGGALMRSQLEPGDHVGVTKLDRAFRSTTDALETAKTWHDRGITLHVLDFGGNTLNLGSPMGRFFLTVQAGLGELERGLASERTKEALTAVRARGVHLGGVPYGYARETDGKLTPDPEEQETLAIIRAGAGLVAPQETAARLNAAGRKNRSGNVWDSSQVAKLIRRLRVSP